MSPGLIVDVTFVAVSVVAFIVAVVLIWRGRRRRR